MLLRIIPVLCILLLLSGCSSLNQLKLTDIYEYIYDGFASRQKLKQLPQEYGQHEMLSYDEYKFERRLLLQSKADTE